MSDADATGSDDDREMTREGGSVDGPGGFPPIGSILGLFALFLLTVVGGFALAGPFEASGVQTFENPENVANVGLIFVEIVVITALFIFIQRYGYGRQVLRLLVLAVFGWATFLAASGSGIPAGDVLGVGLGFVVFVALIVNPEWYVIDAAAVVAGAAIIAQFGNGLGPLPALVFLVGMAGYDAYAVYVSEHMQQLGGGIGELKLPMMYVVPLSLSFSMADLGNPFEHATAEGEDTDGEPDESPPGDETPIILGLGDAIVPGLLAVSGGQFLSPPNATAEPLIEGTILNAPALGALVGSVVGLGGLLGLLYAIERAHAGLPVLNASVILGYLGGALVAGVPIATALGL